MSIRFELKKDFKHSEVGKWMTAHFGPPCDEGENKTWFWSAGKVFKKMNHYGQWEEMAEPEGIRIWKDCPNTTLAILQWSS
jgi:hypothetical protein